MLMISSALTILSPAVELLTPRLLDARLGTLAGIRSSIENSHGPHRRAGSSPYLKRQTDKAKAPPTDEREHYIVRFSVTYFQTSSATLKKFPPKTPRITSAL